MKWAETKGYSVKLGVWHKTNPAPLCGGKYLDDVEYWIMIKGSKVKLGGSYHNKSMVYSSPVNKKDKSLYSHPTVKPVQMLNNFIQVHTNAGDTVFDPFNGSGSSGHAALIEGRNYIGCELMEKYVNVTKKRFDGLSTVLNKWW